MAAVPRLLLCLTALLVVGATDQLGYAQTAPPPVQRVDDCQVIARIGDQVILACEVAWEANMIIQDNLDQIPPDRIDEARQSIMQNQLRRLIDNKLLYTDFRQKARGADMEAINKQFEKIFLEGGANGKAPGAAPALMKVFEVESIPELEKKLIAIGTSLEDRRAAFAERMLAMQWMQEMVKVEDPTHDELVDYYQEHAEEYEFPTQARWEELMVKFRNYPNRAATQAKLVELGNQAWQKYQQQPQLQKTQSEEPLFGEIAREHSEGFNASNGGLYDWTTKGALRDETIDKAIFGLPVGTLSPILETDQGLHIVRVVERREAGRTPFLEVQDEIRTRLKNQRFQEEAQKMVGELRRNTRIWTIYTGNTTAEAFMQPPGGPQRR